MYQRKIKDWEIDKKHKAPEMRAILALTRQNEAVGQPAIFRIRGRLIDIEEVHRYFRRRGEDVSRIDVEDVPIPDSISVDALNVGSPDAGPGDRLDSNTFQGSDNDPAEFSVRFQPEHSTRRSLPDSHGASGLLPGSTDSAVSPPQNPAAMSAPFVHTQGTLAWQMIPNCPNMAAPIDLTFEDQCSRRLLGLTQLFFDAIVPPDFWCQQLSPDGSHLPWRRSLSTWSRATSEGYELLHRGRTRESLALRQEAFSSVGKHITNTSPIILFRYFEIIHAICASGDDTFLLETLNYTLKVSRMVLLPSHPIRELTWLLLLPAVRSFIGPLAHQGISKSLQILYEQCGPNHSRILYVLDSRTQTFLDERQYEKAATEASQYLRRARAIRGEHTFEVGQAWRMLGDSYAATDRLQEAEDAYQYALTLKDHLDSADDRGVIAVKALRGLASLARGQGRMLDTHQYLTEALQAASVAFGPNDVQVMLIQKDLDGLRLPDDFNYLDEQAVCESSAHTE